MHTQSRRFQFLSVVLLSVALAALSVSGASAALITVANRAALGSTISVDWSVFGPAGTTISTPDSRTVSGLTVEVGSSQGQLSRHDEGLDYLGDFAPGAHLLTDGGSSSDTFIVRFAPTVMGFGLQVDPHYIRGPFSGDLEVYSATSALLGTIPFAGVATNAEDNSALFLGVLSNAADIAYFRLFVNQPLPLLRAGAVAINTLDVVRPVPEPASIALLGLGLLAAAFSRRRKI
jgi:hypothetical protein